MNQKASSCKRRATGRWRKWRAMLRRKLKRENPEEYTRRALEALKPRKVTQDVVVWRVPTDAGTVLMWPNGREVRHGGDVQHAEIIKDARLGWVLNPSPMGAEIGRTPRRQ